MPIFFSYLKGMKMRKYKFKVVKSRTNKSCIVNGNSKFSLTYEKDTNVYATEGTLGIMVFKTKVDAQLWMGEWLSGGTKWKIKRVIPIGRGKTPDQICEFVSTVDLELFYEGYLGDAQDDIVPGTICYPGVFVID